MDKKAYLAGVISALNDTIDSGEGLTKVALPWWAYPAASAAGALAGGVMGETPGIGALQGAVLGPAALLGGKAAWRHAGKSAPKAKAWAKQMRGAQPGAKAVKGPVKVTGAEREAYQQAMKRRALGYAGAGGVGAAAGMHGLGSLGFGDFSDMARAPGRAEAARQAQLMQLAQQYPEFTQ